MATVLTIIEESNEVKGNGVEWCFASLCVMLKSATGRRGLAEEGWWKSKVFFTTLHQIMLG